MKNTECLVLTDDYRLEFQKFDEMNGTCIAQCHGVYPNPKHSYASGHIINDVKKWADYFIRKKVGCVIPYNPYQENPFY